MLTGEEVLLSHGPLVDAVLASAAIPGVLPAVEWEGRLLIDGGVVNNTPLSHAIALGARDSTAALMQQAAVLAIALPNSRESEAEADQIGIELAARAGYDPRSAVTLWEKMGKVGGKGPPEFLSTHPSPENRAARLKELGQKVQPLYLAAKSNPPTATRSYLPR